MKKLVCVVMLVLMSACSASGEGAPAHIVIRNAMKCTGGNDSVFVQEHDYSSWDYDPPDNPDDYASINVLAQEWSALPKPKDTPPVKSYGLMNDYEPVEITVYGNRLEISDWGGDDVYSFRIFDAEGKFITGDSILNEKHNVVSMDVTSEPAAYYLEFAQTRVSYDDPEEITIETGRAPEYCYILMRIGGGREKRLKSSPVRVPDNYETAQSELEDYMKRHNIKNMSDLTADDFVNISVERARKNSQPLVPIE